MDETIRIFMVGGLGACAVVFLGSYFRWWSELRESGLPDREKLLRSPGESMRRNLEQLNEYLIYSVAIFLLVPLAFAWKTPNLTSVWPVTFFVCLMILCAVPGVCVTRLYHRYAQGLRAERAVGEELNQLMLDGCHVFHDYPARPDWVINHIVVAFSGVYAIETSSPGPRTPGLRRNPGVVFDGLALKFPKHTSTKLLEQARRSAAILQDDLRDILEGCEVKSVLSLPGWRLIRQGTGDVEVLQPKEIWQAIVTPRPAALSDIKIQEIARRLQQKCRDVEL